MNKQEAIEKLESNALNIGDNDLVVGLNVAKHIINQIDEPQKPVVPKFVAEWIKSQKESFSDVSAIDMYDNLTLDNNGGYYHDVWLWVIEHHYDFIKAWHDGYEVEKEKLYIVELPSPNCQLDDHYALSRLKNGKIIINKYYIAQWERFGDCQLTESEIKEDFEWAWQFAEEVEE